MIRVRVRGVGEWVKVPALNIICLYQDRPTELIPKLRGVLTNPNCEFYPNFVAIHTLATWCKSTSDGGQRDVEMGEHVFLFATPVVVRLCSENSQLNERLININEV